MNAQLKHIEVTASPRSILKALGATFTNSNTVVFELIQNAGRAGASQVTLTFDEAARVLVIEDDGCGIGDSSKLLALAESGWDAAIQASEAPYGIGFVSALFGAEEIEIESLSFALKARTEEILDLRPVAIQPSPFRPGARITLRGTRFHINRFGLEERLAGFPIPVVVNGEVLERPLQRVDADTWGPTDIGHVRLNLNDSSCVAVLQGMVIDRHWRSRVPAGDRTTVHLDATQFFGRMPDRMELIDARSARERIRATLMALARQQLKARKAALGGRAFVESHAEHCRTWDCIELLNDVNYLPSGWLNVFAEQPRQARWSGDEATEQLSASKVLSRAEIPDLVLIDVDLDDEAPWTALAYAWAKRLPMLEVHLHQDHWINGRCANPEDLAVELVDAAGPSARFDGDRVWDQLTLVPTIRIRGPLGEVELKADAALRTEDGFLVQPGSSSWVLLQASDYIDGDTESHDESAFNTDRGTFDRCLRALAGEDPTTTVRSALVDAGISGEIAEALRNSGPMVLYLDDQGKLAVMSTESTTLSKA